MSMRSIFRKIARENAVTVAEVKRDMQEAITHAYTHTLDDGITVAYQNRVLRKGEIPTPEEFMKHAAKELRRREVKQKA